MNENWASTLYWMDQGVYTYTLEGEVLPYNNKRYNKPILPLTPSNHLVEKLKQKNNMV